MIAVNEFGRCWDDLDAVRARVTVASMVPRGAGYTVLTEDGKPLTGFAPKDREQPCVAFTAVGWRAS